MTDSGAAEGAKRAAALRAVAEVTNGMVVGLGSGSTATFAIEALAERAAKGLRIVGIPTSEKSAALAKRLGISITDFAAHRRIDVTIDGADQVARGSFDLIKGLGGALLREKIVASASARMIVVIDESKLVDRLGGQTPLPVEIAAFGWQIAFDRLTALGGAPKVRAAGDHPFMTDGGNYIADCSFATIADPASLDAALSMIPGVIGTGLFIGLASTIMVGRASGVDVIEVR